MCVTSTTASSRSWSSFTAVTVTVCASFQSSSSKSSVCGETVSTRASPLATETVTGPVGSLASRTSQVPVVASATVSLLLLTLIPLSSSSVSVTLATSTTSGVFVPPPWVLDAIAVPSIWIVSSPSLTVSSVGVSVSVTVFCPAVASGWIVITGGSVPQVAV